MCVCVCVWCARARECVRACVRDRQTNRQAGRQAGRQAQRHRDRDTEKQRETRRQRTYRQTNQLNPQQKAKQTKEIILNCFIFKRFSYYDYLGYEHLTASTNMNFDIDNSCMNRNNFTLQCSVETNIHEVGGGGWGGGGGERKEKSVSS